MFSVPGPRRGPMMTGVRFGSLGLTLILITPVLRAEEGSLPSVPAGNSKKADGGTKQPTNVPASGVSLARPVVLTSRSPADGSAERFSGIQPTSFNDPTLLPPVARGQSADPAPALPRRSSVWGEAVGPLPTGTVVSDSHAVAGRVIASSGGPAIPIGPPAGSGS